jgi:hypothetical protein
MGRAKEAAFYDWLRIVEDRKQAELAADESLKVNYELSRRVALTWMKRNISFAFIRWRNNAKAYKMQRRRLETALVRMTSRVSFAAFSAWTQTVERNKRRRTILRRAAMRMSKRMLVVAFSDWCAKVEEKRYWDAQAVKIERCVLAIANRGMKRAFGRWVEQWKTARMHRRRLATALTRMTQRAVFKCFNQWLDEAANRRRSPRGTLARDHETLAPHPGVGVRPMDGVHSRERRREHGARRVGEEGSQGGEVREELWTQKSPSRFQPVARGDNRAIVDATQGSQRDRQVR